MAVVFNPPSLAGANTLIGEYAHHVFCVNAANAVVAFHYGHFLAEYPGKSN